MANQYFLPRPCHLDDLGEIVRLGRLQFFEAGTPTAKEVFSDPDLTITAGSVVDLDSAGRLPDNTPQIWFGYGNYKIILQSFATGVWVDVWEAPFVAGSVSPSASTTASDVTVNTIADLKLIDTDEFTRAYVIGAASVTGGGGGHFRWSSLDANNDDGGWYIQRATGGIGRWIRILESGVNYLDIKMWQAQSNIGPIDSAYNSAYAIAVTKNLPVYFGSGMWKWQDSTTVFGHVFIDEGARFSTVTVGTFDLIFAGRVEINSKSSLTTLDDLKISFSGSSLEYYDIRWGVNFFEASASAVLSNLPLRIEEPIVLPFAIGSAETQIIIGPKGFIDCDNYELKCQSIEVEGNRRKVISTAGPIPLISKIESIQAWWFGYGVDTVETDYTDYLILADAVAVASGSMLVINRSFDIGGVERTVELSSDLVFEGPINLNTNTSLVTVNSFSVMPFTRIFTMTGTAKAVVNNYPANPLWWGVLGTNSASANWDAWKRMMYSVSVNQEFVDGKNIRFSITGNADICGGVAGLTSLRIFNMVISSTTLLAPVFLNTNQLVLEMSGVRLLGPDTTASMSLISTTANGFYRFIGCEFKSGIVVGLSASGQFLEVAECEIWNNGNIAVVTGQFPTVSIHDNVVNAGTIIVATNAYDQLNNISIIDNKFINCDATYGDIVLSTAVTNTYVNNVNIEGNKFTWIGGVSEKILINTTVSGSGTFVDYQNIRVCDNSVNGTHVVAGAYPDLGAVGGPYVSATFGSDVILFGSVDISDAGASDYYFGKAVRIGPLFIPFLGTQSAISGEINCEQVAGLNSQGIVVGSSSFTFQRTSSATNNTAGRYLEGLATAKVLQAYRTVSNTYYMRVRATIFWGLRGDIGRNSNNTL